MNKSKQIIRDDVNGDIFIPNFAFDIIDTTEFQRLRRIKQLGGVELVYIGANHNRFQHSIGVFHNLKEIKNKNKTHDFSEKKWKLILIAGLLHDIGHGPLSHSIESITNGKLCHEKIGKEIIMNKETEIYKVLIKNKINPKDIIDMFDEKKNPIASQLLSSHIDADRMDYLLRDAHNTGTKYGLFDKDKLIKSMDLSGTELTFSKSAIPAIESFLFARYQSFKSIYLHRTSLVYEEMIKSLFIRLKELKNEKEYKEIVSKLSPILGEMDLKKYLKLDDAIFNSIFMELKYSKDPVLKDFASRIVDRRLFAAWEYDSKKLPEIKRRLKAKNLDPKYYLIECSTEKSPYTYKETKSILISSDGKKPVDIRKISDIVKTLSQTSYKRKYTIIPKGIM